MIRERERDELSERYERESRNIDGESSSLQEEGEPVRGENKFKPLQSIEDLNMRVIESTQNLWYIRDKEKKSYRDVHRFFYEFSPGESYFDFHKKLIYSVHPEILEKKEYVSKLTDQEFHTLGKNYYASRRNYLLEKRKKKRAGKNDLDDEQTNPSDEKSDEPGNDVFGELNENKDNVAASLNAQDNQFDRGSNFKWWKKTPVHGQEAEYLGRNFKIEIYKETLEDIDPIFCEYPRHDVPHVDLYLRHLEEFSLWQTTRLMSMGFICTFPILVGMVLARAIPISVGGGDIMKILKSKMVYKGGFHSAMNRREASLILGVKQNATKEEIRARHRKLMIFNHPDNGGSQLIATKINEAKELMFKGDI